MTTLNATAPTFQPARASRWWRWLLRPLLVIAAVLLVLAVIVQIVLWTNLPKKLVISAIESELGLRISAGSLSTGWTGHTELRNVSLGLPLGKQSFFTVYALKVRHTSIFGLILFRAVSVDRIELDHPIVYLSQDTSTGQWNLLEVAEILKRALGAKPANEAQQKGVPRLPEVILADGVVQVTTNQKQQFTLAPLNVRGQPLDVLAWKYEVRLGDQEQIKLTGQVAPGGTWRHVVDLAVGNLDQLAPGLAFDSHDLVLAAHWDGTLGKDNQVVGRLQINQLSGKGLASVGKLSVSGAIDMTAAGGTISLSPRALSLKTGFNRLADVQLASGAIAYDANGITIENLQLAVLGGVASLNGKFDPAALSGNLSLRWNGLNLPGSSGSTGSIVASLQTPFQNHPQIKIDLDAHGKVSGNSWDVAANLTGLGTSWSSIDWVLSAPRLSYSGTQKIELAELNGHFSQRGPVLTMNDLTLPVRPHMTSQAQIDFAQGKWFFWLDAGGWERPARQGLPLSLSINAWGDADQYTLQELRLRAADADLWIGGEYDRRKPNPMSLDAYLMQAGSIAPDSAIQGHANGSFHLAGRLWSPDPGDITTMVFQPQLGVGGYLKSTDLSVRGRAIGDLNVQITGKFDNGQLQLSTTHMKLFRGEWWLDVRYPQPGQVDTFGVDLNASEVPIDELASFMQVPNVVGVLTTGNWHVDIPRQAPDLKHVLATTDMELAGVGASGLVFDGISAHAHMQDGLLKMDPVIAKSGIGVTNISGSYDLNNPRHALVQVHVKDWPTGAPTSALVKTSAESSLDIDFGKIAPGINRKPSVSGQLNATADLSFAGAPLAHLDVETTLMGRSISMQKLNGNMLGGTVEGTGTFNLDKPLDAVAQVRWYQVNSALLTTINPTLKDISGIYSGTITLGPAKEPRPLEPVKIEMNIAAENARVRTIRIGEDRIVAFHGVAFANVDRIVLDHSDLHIADGVVHLWARAGKGLQSQSVQFALEDLQLNQLAHFAKNDDKPMPGLVSGTIQIMGSGLDTSLLQGRANFELRKSELATFTPIAALYNAMSIGAAGSEPSGVGNVEMSLEQNNVRVTAFRYFNRGVDARGLATITNVWSGQDAQVAGQLVGTLQLLKDTKIPFLASFDEALGAIQSNLTTINVGGTLGDIRPSQAGLDQLGNDLKSFLVGDMRSQTWP